MRIIANENIAGSVIQNLRLRGHDVVSVKETMRGAKDVDILSCAQTEQRLVITHDQDFGELAFRFGLPAECGVILFRLSGEDPVTNQHRIVVVLQSRTDWLGHFSVVDDKKIRFRPIPVIRSSPGNKF